MTIRGSKLVPLLATVVALLAGADASRSRRLMAAAAGDGLAGALPVAPRSIISSLSSMPEVTLGRAGVADTGAAGNAGVDDGVDLCDTDDYRQSSLRLLKEVPFAGVFRDLPQQYNFDATGELWTENWGVELWGALAAIGSSLH